MTSWTPTAVWPVDLIHAGDLTCTALEELLDLAASMKAQPGDWTDALRGASLACLFETPDTRAGLSTEAAAHRLGMEPIRIHPAELGLPDGETLGDAVRILSTYSGAIVTRDVGDERLHEITRTADVPVINARSPDQHPTQALADLFTLREHFGSLAGRALAYVGPATNIAVSLMQACALASMQIRLACPRDQRPTTEDLTAAEVLADLHDATVAVLDDPRDAVEGADAVYGAPWPVAPPGADPRRWQETARRYQITTPLIHHARPDAVFLHSLPAQRGREVTAGVLDDRRRSLVWQQAENRLHVDQAILFALITTAGAS